jgi:hypothetical protein
MSTQVVLDLPENTFRSAVLLARGSQQSIQGMLTETVTQALTGWDLWERSAATMTDLEVLEVSDSRMDPVQGRRFGLLLDKQQAGTLAPEERPELWTLTRIYQLGQLRKAEALAEAVKRGLRPPFDA